MPYVAHRKHSGNARFQKEWLPLQRPAIRARALLEEVCSSEDKSAVVALDKAFEPFGARRRPDEHEQRSRRHAFDRPGTCARYRDRLQLVLSVDRDYLCAALDTNVGSLRDVVDQILR